MKKFLSFLFYFCSLSYMHANIICDITTGHYQSNNTLISPPNCDDDWKLIQYPGSGPINSCAYVTNGILWTGSGESNAWGTPPTCGRWLSATAMASGDALFTMPLSVPAGDPLQDYVYELKFNYNVCCLSNFKFNINAVGFDETPVIKLNGHQYTLHSGIISINPGDLICGLNSLTVRMTNTSAATGFYICGTIEGDPTPIVPNITGSASFCSNDPLIFNGNTSTGPIQYTYWEIAECTSTGIYNNPSAVWHSPTWNPGAPGAIDFSSINLGFTPQCGKYYKIKLAVKNPCDAWEEANKIIYITCSPTINVQDPPPVCEGTTVTLSVSGNATSYTWGAPINQTVNSVSITAASNFAYPVTGILNGCTSTAYAHVVVAPANLDIDISTGVYNNFPALIPFGLTDDSWKIRGVPGTIYTGAHSTLADAKVVSALTGQPVGLNWVSSPNEEWISTTSDVNGKPIAVPVSIYNNTPTSDYWFEAEFNLPISTYTNLRIEANESAVDNRILLYLNSAALTGTANNQEYSEFSGLPAAFNMLHYPGIIAVNQAHYLQGTNTILAEVENDATYMGMLLNAHVKGTCTPTRRIMNIPEDIMQTERLDATTFIYPNPSSGNFTLSCDGQTILMVTIKDVLGKTIKTLNEVNASTCDISLENEMNGFYFVEIRYAGQQKIIYKKIIKN